MARPASSPTPLSAGVTGGCIPHPARVRVVDRSPGDRRRLHTVAENFARGRSLTTGTRLASARTARLVRGSCRRRPHPSCTDETTAVRLANRAGSSRDRRRGARRDRDRAWRSGFASAATSSSRAAPRSTTRVEVGRMVEETGTSTTSSTSIAATASLFMIRRRCTSRPDTPCSSRGALRRASTCRSSASTVPGPARAGGRSLERGSATWSAWCKADARTPVRGQGPGRVHRRHPVVSELQPGSASGGWVSNRRLAGIENPRTGRESRGRRGAAGAVGRRVPRDRGRTGRAAGHDAAARNGHHVTVLRAQFTPAARSAWRRCRTRPSSGIWSATRSTRARPPGSDDRVRVDVTAPRGRASRSGTGGSYTGAVAARFRGGRATGGRLDRRRPRRPLPGRSAPLGDVVVLDELGFHHATSVAEVLADRGCQMRSMYPGMVVIVTWASR